MNINIFFIDIKNNISIFYIIIFFINKKYKLLLEYILLII